MLRVAMRLAFGLFVPAIAGVMNSVVAAPGSLAHRDPAPLSDEVVRKIVTNGHENAQESAPIAALNRHLDGLAEIVAGHGGAERRMLVAAKRHEIAITKQAVFAEIAVTRKRLQALGLATQVAAWDQLAEQARERFDRLDRSLASVDIDSKDKHARALDRLQSELVGMRGGALDAINGSLKWPTAPVLRIAPRKGENQPALPASQRKPAFESMRVIETQYASLDNSILASAPQTPPEAIAGCSYTQADLNATPDAPKDDPQIKSLAEQLSYSPINIYQYVYNNIEFQPYYGSLKGAIATLQSKSGGPTDQASLLIALLRASNIPARYVRGRINVLDPINDATGGRVANWVGAKSYDGAQSILWIGGANSNWVTNGISLNHVWVEACVPYGHYRGAAVDNTGQRWIPLDPSFKDKTYQPGVKRKYGFQFAEYLSKRQNGPDSLPLESYRRWIDESFRRLGQDNTSQDVPYKGAVNPLILDILPTSLPYEVAEYTNWSNTSSPETSELPSSHRHRLYLSGMGLPDVSSGQAFSLYIPDVVNKRLTLSFKGIGPDEQAALDSYRQKDLTASIPCGIKVIPILLADGVDLSLPSPASGIDICSSNNILNLEIGVLESRAIAPGDENDPNRVGRMNATTYTTISPANLYAVLAYAYQGSDALLAQHAANITHAVNTINAPNASMLSLDSTEGAFLYLIGLKYMRYITDAATAIGELDGGSGASGEHLGLVSAQIKVQYLFDLPFAVSRAGFLVDVAGAQFNNRDLVSGQIVESTSALTGYSGSAYESYVLQENVKFDAVSTVRALQYANEVGPKNSSSGGEIYADYTTTPPTILYNGGSLYFDHSGNNSWDAFSSKISVVPGCAQPAPGATAYPRCWVFIDQNNPNSEQSKRSIQYIYNQGYIIRMPKGLVNYSGWQGMVYAAHKGGQSKFIIGRFNGGYSVGTSLLPYGYNSSLQASYVPILSVPTYLYSPPTAGALYDPAPIYSITASNGYTPLTTLSGDPVNMVSGNLYHNETDIKIKGRGGLDLVFSRAYNSRNPVDGPLGFGWTHSFNASLKFYGVDGTLAKLSWIDGSGSEKFFSTTSHTNGAINTGATINDANATSSPGVYVTFKRLADGAYTIREKNGLTYTFASAAGPNATPSASVTPVVSRLQSIQDRNGNTLTLSYTATAGCTGAQVCTVTDSVGHTLSFTYSGNHIVEIKDFTGRTFQYGYADGNSNLTSFKNPLAVAGKQNGVTYSYFTTTDGVSLGHAMKQYLLPRGNGMKFEYYANGRVFRHTMLDTKGNALTDHVNTFTYNDFRRETVQTNELGGQKHFFFDAFGNPIQYVDENGAEHNYTYDCTDPTATPGTASCANPYSRLSETDAAGYTTKYLYEKLTAGLVDTGNVVQVTTPRKKYTWSSDFNAFGQARRVSDVRGNWSIYRYDATGNLIDRINTTLSYTPPACPAAECDIPPAQSIVSWTVNGYDSAGNLTSTKQVRDFAAQIATNTALSNTGPIITFGYDANKWNAITTSRIGIQNADTVATTVNTATLSYDNLGRLKNGVDADWYPTQAVYDELDRAVQATDKLGKLRTYTFDANGNATGQSLKTSSFGFSTQVDSTSSRYDDTDKVAASLDAGGFVTSYTYDAAGNVLTTTNPDNYRISFDYDEANRPVHAYDQENHSVTTTRDVSGRTRTVTDPNGNVTTYAYWGASQDGRLKSVTYPLNKNNQPGNATDGAAFTSARSVQTDYDAAGNVIKSTETPAAQSGVTATPRVTSTEFDELNRPTRIVGPQYTDATRGAICPVTFNTYDTLGRLTKVASGYTPSPCTTASSDVLTGAGTSTQSFAYDDFGRKIKSTDGLNRSWVYTYDNHNNLQTAKDPKSQTTTYTWDVGHQLLSRTEQGGRKTTYTRNDLGQVKAVSHPEATYSYSYDAAHRLTSVTDSRGNKTLNYDWSPGGWLNSVTDSDGRKTLYRYDPVGRLAGITAPNGDVMALQYDDGGRLLQRTMPNGVAVRYQYNEDNSLRQVANYNAAGTLFSQHDYAYDGVGSRALYALNMPALGGTQVTKYNYDELGRLTKTDIGDPTYLETYAYDPVGNRVKVAGGTSQQTSVFSYDAANQVQTVAVTPNGGTASNTTYSYDANGNLTSDGTYTYVWDSLNQLSQIKSGSTVVAAFSYDSEGRRIKRVIGGTATKQWQYDGDNIYAEYAATWATPGAVYTHGTGSDTPLMSMATTGASSYGGANYFYADGLGTIQGLSTNLDTTTQFQFFDGWGQATFPTLEQQSVGNAPYIWAGREDDGAGAGLVYMRARYYQPATGRFISRDPIGLKGGLNPYAYCENDPINCTDPSGLMPSFQSALASSYAGSAGFYNYSTPSSSGGISSGYQSLAAAAVFTSSWGAQSAETVAFDAVVARAMPWLGRQAVSIVARSGPVAAFIGLMGAPRNFGPTYNERVPTIGQPYIYTGSVYSSGANDSDVTKRPSRVRSGTEQGNWDNAEDGPTGGKLCPTCGGEVSSRPRDKNKDWDNDHNPPWRDRDLSDKDRKGVLDEYNRDTRLRCVGCNRADNGR